MRVSLDLEITGMQEPDRKVCVEFKKMYFHFVVPILKTNTLFLVLFLFYSHLQTSSYHTTRPVILSCVKRDVSRSGSNGFFNQFCAQ